MAEQQEKQSSKEIIKITEVQQRWAKTFAGNRGGQSFDSFLTTAGSFFVNDPYLLNQRIKALASAQQFKERSVIEDALLEPGYNEQTLREATHSLINTTYPLYRLIMLYEGILSYHSYVRPAYVKKDEMDKPRFTQEWKFIDKWHKKLNPQKQFRRIVEEVLPEGKRAYYFRQNYSTESKVEDVDYVHFQLLPSDWYKIIKHSTDSYEVVAFNFAYFWQAGTDLGQFPEVFAEYYSELMNATEMDRAGRRWIDPAKTPEDVVLEYNSDTLTWFYWKELPADECFVFCFTEANDNQISPFCSLLLQSQDLASYSLLQQQLLTIPLYSILLGELPMSDNNKSGSYVDDYKLQPEAVSVFEGKVNGQMPPGTTYTMVPSKANQLFSFQEIPNANKIYNDGLQQLINTTGASTLVSTTERPSVAQVNAGKIIETRFIDRIYAQFEHAVNIILQNMYYEGDLRYEWRFKIYGDSFSEKDAITAIEKTLSLGQTQFMPEYLGYRDMSLLDAVTISDWVDSSGIYESMKPLTNTFTTSGKSQPAGRPKVAEEDVENDNTAAQLDNGTNITENR